jgi:hypothetical protein
LGHTAGRDDRSIYDPEPGGVLYISRGFVWRPAHDIASAAPGKDQRRTDYEAFVARKKSDEPLTRADRWFTDFAKVYGSVLIDPKEMSL